MRASRLLWLISSRWSRWLCPSCSRENKLRFSCRPGLPGLKHKHRRVRYRNSNWLRRIKNYWLKFKNWRQKAQWMWITRVSKVREWRWTRSAISCKLRILNSSRRLMHWPLLQRPSKNSKTVRKSMPKLRKLLLSTSICSRNVKLILNKLLSSQ